MLERRKLLEREELIVKVLIKIVLASELQI
jgi:hypothetical protein